MANELSKKNEEIRKITYDKDVEIESIKSKNQYNVNLFIQKEYSQFCKKLDTGIRIAYSVISFFVLVAIITVFFVNMKTFLNIQPLFFRISVFVAFSIVTFADICQYVIFCLGNMKKIIKLFDKIKEKKLKKIKDKYSSLL